MFPYMPLQHHKKNLNKYVTNERVIEPCSFVYSKARNCCIYDGLYVELKSYKALFLDLHMTVRFGLNSFSFVVGVKYKQLSFRLQSQMTLYPKNIRKKKSPKPQACRGLTYCVDRLLIFLNRNNNGPISLYKFYINKPNEFSN